MSAAFDTTRGADNIMPLLNDDQRAFILRMKPKLTEQRITVRDWDNVDPKVDNPDLDGWPWWHWFGGMRLTWREHRAVVTFQFNNDGLAVRERLARGDQ